MASALSYVFRESGLSSLVRSGTDAHLLILARTLRMLAFGAASLILALFFSALAFSNLQIGLFMTLTLTGDVLLSFFISFVADSLGRRRILLAGGVAMSVSGAVFATCENFWVLLGAAVIGVVSATGSDFGPFRAIEESMISGLTSKDTRNDVLSWYITLSSLGSAVGTLLGGRLVDAVKGKEGWDELAAYHAMFWVYVVMGAGNVVCAFCMSDKCEMQAEEENQHDQDEGDEAAQGLLNDQDAEEVHQEAPDPAPKEKGKITLSQISSSTRAVMYKLWFLLTIDSLADGMVSYTLTTYYLSLTFSLSKATLGDIMSTCYILMAVSTVFAAPLARHIGLLNTMVFTHVPSSLAVLLFPLPSSLIIVMILLFVRTGLNNMDQAPRTAFIAAVVKPGERTAVMGITATLRTLGGTIGPTLTGGLAQGHYFWAAFVIGGALRLAYDFGLWAMFVNVKLHEHESPDEGRVGGRKEADEESGLEMGRLEERHTTSP